MPIATVQLPDGVILDIRIPENATSEQIISTAKQYYNQNLRSQEPQATQPQTTQQTPTQTQPQARQAQLQQFRDETTRDLGLGARAVIEGAAFLPAAALDLATLGINATFDKDIPFASDLLSKGLSDIGLPEPETGGERVFGDVVGGAIGGAGIAKGIQALGTKLPKIIQQLAGKPAVEAIAGGASAGVAGGVREMGGTPGQQLGFGLVGGFGAGAGASRVLRSAIKGKPIKLLEDIGETGINEPTAFVQVREALQKESNRLKKRINPLFEQAKEKGKNAFISSEQIKQLSNKFKELAIDEIDRDGKDILTSASKRLDELAVNKIRVNDLEGLRRSASQTSRSGGTKGAIGHKIFTGIDEFLENAVIEGDQSAISVWKKAITARREFAQKFEIPKKIAKAVDEDQTIETIEQLFLGSGIVQKDLGKTYKETLEALQPKKRQRVGFALRQAELNRIIKVAVQRSDSKEGLSAATLANSIKNLRMKNKTFWDKFTDLEKNELTKLETGLRKISKGGIINRVYTALEKIISKGLRSNIELPRTLKAKTIVTVEDLLELSSFRPKSKAEWSQLSTASPSIVTPLVKEEQQQ